jgi:hypothetical protein
MKNRVSTGREGNPVSLQGATAVIRTTVKKPGFPLRRFGKPGFVAGATAVIRTTVKKPGFPCVGLGNPVSLQGRPR